VAVVLKVPQVTKPIVTAGLAAAAIVAAGTACLAASASGGRICEILPPSAACIAAAAIAAAVAKAEAVLAPLGACCCVLLLSAAAAHYSAYPSAEIRADSAATALVVHVGLLEGIALIIVVVNAFVAHWRRRWRVAQAAHNELVAQAAVMAAVAEGDSDSSVPVLRQLLNEMLLDLPSWEGISLAGKSGWKGKCRVRRELGSLLSRANVVAPLLRRKAEEWALLSHGCFPVALGASSGHELIEWSRASREPTLATRICWPSVMAQKAALCRLGRALTTTSSTSGGHAEWELAVCYRVGIYFQDVGGILALLETLRRDPEAKVISCSNRLGPSPTCPGGVPNHDCPSGCCRDKCGWTSCGSIVDSGRACSFSCRDDGAWCVALDLVFVSDLSRRLGLDSQVCQLLLFLANCCSGEELLVCTHPPQRVCLSAFFWPFLQPAIMGHALQHV
jgi:hypothetical protein